MQTFVFRFVAFYLIYDSITQEQSNNIFKQLLSHDKMTTEFEN